MQRKDAFAEGIVASAMEGPTFVAARINCCALEFRIELYAARKKTGVRLGL